MSDKNEVLIQVTDLKRHFDKGKIKALDGVSLEIDQGEVVVIIGPSGSGKSTLLRSLNLLEEPTSGQILVDGVDITDPKVDINVHRQKMGMVFQHFNVFLNMTVLRNMRKYTKGWSVWNSLMRRTKSRVTARVLTQSISAEICRSMETCGNE